MRCSRSASRRDPLAVAAELRVVGRQQLQPGDGALAELVDHATITEDAVDLPVRRDRAEVHDLHVALGRYLLELFGLHRHADQRSGRRFRGSEAEHDQRLRVRSP